MARSLKLILAFSIIGCTNKDPLSDKSNKSEVQTQVVEKKPWGIPGRGELPQRIVWAPRKSLPKSKTDLTTLSWESITSRLNEKQYSALKAYLEVKPLPISFRTINKCTSLDIENLSCPFYPDLLNLNKGSVLIRDLKETCSNLSQAYESLPKSVGTVFRGVNSVPIEEIHRLENAHLHCALISLGPQNMPIWLSTSRDPQIALNFSGASMNHSYGIFFQIKQRNGISVEQVSKAIWEAEVILPPTSLFRVIDLSPVAGYDHLLLATVEEQMTTVDLKRLEKGYCEQRAQNNPLQ
jgi:hypothetical protein